MHKLDQDSADCFLFTHKEGLLSAVAHDLQIKVTRFQIDLDESARTTSLRVICAMQDGKEPTGTLSADQKREIEGTIAREVLAATRYPQVRYASTAVAGDGDEYRVTGQLSLHGTRKQTAVRPQS